MNMEDGTSLLWGVGALILTGSSLLARRLPLGQTLKMIFAWVSIFAVLFAIFSYRYEFSVVWQRIKSDLSGMANQKTVGKTIQIMRGDNGHFSVTALVNGRKVNFMIDSGATITSINSDTAKAANINISANSFPVMIETANGKIMGSRAIASSLDIGGIQLNDHTVFVLDNFGETNVLGMNFLDSLKSWKVEGVIMTLEHQ